MMLPDFLVARRRDSAKWDYGHAFLIAGSYGRVGCAILAAKAALRTGCGLLTAHVPHRCVDPFQAALPEAMLSIDPDPCQFTATPERIERCHAVAIGPGIGTEGDMHNTLALVFEHLEPKVPVILDADALTLLARHPKGLVPMLNEYTILTPHAREFDRLWGKPLRSDADRRKAAIELSARWNTTILLKGCNTFVASPDGRNDLISTGNAGMATAGSGDVLTGILLGLASQNAVYDSNLRYTTHEIALLGAQIHGKCGEIYAKMHPESTLIASDLIKNIPNSIQSLSEE